MRTSQKGTARCGATLGASVAALPAIRGLHGRLERFHTLPLTFGCLHPTTGSELANGLLTGPVGAAPAFSLNRATWLPFESRPQSPSAAVGRELRRLFVKTTRTQRVTTVRGIYKELLIRCIRVGLVLP